MATTALLAASVAACATAASTGSPGPGSSGGPTGDPTATPPASPSAPTGLEHPTGATDVVLRFEESGGFAPVEFMATNAPSFTLYGDGTVVFRDPFAAPPETGNNVRLSVPFQTVRLDEEGVQALLEAALGQGGLAVATGPYLGNMADIPTSTFTISVGGKTKQVSVSGLSPEAHPQNQAIVAQLAAFAERLRTFADQVAGEQPYQPAAYRGVLMQIDQPFGPVVAWPWSDFKPADFKPDANDFFKLRTMSPAEVAVLGIDGAAGGMTGVALQSEGKLYTFSLRPLLPEETQ